MSFVTTAPPEPGAVPASSLAAEQVRAAVARACRAMFGRSTLPAATTLAQAGCDSMGLMQFDAVLQRELGRPVPLDLLDTAMTPDQVVASLLGPQPALPAARPTVFLLPGLDDDQPRLARFRVALRDRVRFHLVAYPDWPDMMRRGWQFADLVGSVAAQVLRETGSAPILLTGYSFGGEVGFAVACHLVERGADVRWLGILDTDITRVPSPPSEGPLGRARRFIRESGGHQRQGLNKPLGLALAKLARSGPGLEFAHRLDPWWRPWLPPRTEFWFDRRTRSVMRAQAIWQWMAAASGHRLHVPTTLFRSQFGLGPSPLHMGWAPRCPNLSIVMVGGDHHSLFDPPHRELLYARYAEAVAQLADRGLTAAPAGAG
jgi:thioesterase domain-containing protein